MTAGPSRHLSWDELRCEDGTPYPQEWRDTRAVELAQTFEVLRRVCGDRPIAVISGYRSPAHNKAVGGASASQHMQGRALDLQCPDHLTLDQFEALAKSIAAHTKLRGLGRYAGKNSLHIDVRPGTQLTRWHDHHAWSEAL